ncbi:aldo/keto reductase [Ktedonospora formicarum]|uniref:Aldo/keto reductase n=1 Tax=Ktedonospora formicarum TaxID=2778364 RepID=A0A8J3HS89_9CHLR|nr:aldo/keto reductase [Ktedonospora formicarum]GHO42704.1 aldo/keto reductase [Ktedonospora formicarum]
MQYRPFGRTGWKASEIGFGAWGIGGDAWGQQDDQVALAALHTAIDQGVNFIDTADVYGDGHSEQLIAQILKERKDDLFVATKLGRRLNPHVASGYNNRQNLKGFVERSLRNLNVEALDLVQLHCPPSEVYAMTEVFSLLDELQQQGKIRHYGVSVEKVEEALRAIQYPNVKSVQIIFNMFRLKPAEQFFAEARKREVGIIVRVPLASGLLTGKFGAQSQFASSDHRNYNRHGEAFDQGETFSGVDYEEGLQAVDELRALVPGGMTMAQFALRWTLMFPEVSTVIAGARNPQQARDNASVSELPPLSDATMKRVQEIYDQRFRTSIHPRW